MWIHKLMRTKFTQVTNDNLE